RNEVESNGVRFHQTTECDVEQQQILNLLKVALSPPPHAQSIEVWLW
ncbi:MAG: hypothetical protein ACI9R3_006212, partial [Verrucomicrobiales bacterium]